jgi:hypothetical protein
MKKGLCGLTKMCLLLAAIAAAAPAGAQILPPIRTERVVWTNVFGVVPTGAGNSLVKVARPGWNAGATSNKVIAYGDGSVRFVATETNTFRVGGLGHVDKSQALEDVEFGWFLGADGWAYPVEGGVIAIWPGVQYKPGTVFEVAIRGGRVVFSATGAPSTYAVRPPRYPLGFDTSLHDTRATITDAWITGYLEDAPHCCAACTN